MNNPNFNVQKHPFWKTFEEGKFSLDDKVRSKQTLAGHVVWLGGGLEVGKGYLPVELCVGQELL